MKFSWIFLNFFLKIKISNKVIIQEQDAEPDKVLP
jgi:hypothetical protein